MKGEIKRYLLLDVTLSFEGDVVTDEMDTAALKVAELAFKSNGARLERTAC